MPFGGVDQLPHSGRHTVLIHFSKARFWVVPADLVAYARWRVGAAESLRDGVRSLWAPSLHRAYHAELGAMLRKAAELGVTPGCLRFPSDGTRLQVFDFARRIVCKMQAPWARENRIESELAARSKVGELAPPVIRVASSMDAFVEAWVPRSRAIEAESALENVVPHLEAALYRPELTDARIVIDGLSRAQGSWAGLSRETRAALIAHLPDELPITQVHGDLSPHNVTRRKDGSLQLLDWEYTRATVKTYDLWHFLYEARRDAKSLGPLTNDFTSAFADRLEVLGCSGLRQHAAGLHVLHLVERLSFLSSVVTEDRIGVLANILRADIADGTKLLMGAPRGVLA